VSALPRIGGRRASGDVDVDRAPDRRRDLFGFL
jgi:hypothetical protein